MEDHLGFSNIQYVAKSQKIEVGSLETRKIFRKVSAPKKIRKGDPLVSSGYAPI